MAVPGGSGRVCEGGAWGRGTGRGHEGAAKGVKGSFMSQRKLVRPERMRCVGRALRWRAVRDGRAAPRYGRLDMGEVLDGGHWPEKWCKFPTRCRPWVYTKTCTSSALSEMLGDV